MTEKEAIEKIKTSCFTGDTDCDHGSADSILCEFLESLGYTELVKEYDEVDKWYA